MKSENQPMSFKKWALLGASIAFVMMVTKSCSKVVDEKWEQKASVYDIRSEVHWGMLTTIPQGVGLWLGLGDDSWILKPIVALNNKLYESGIAKIPENDGERARLWYQYKYWPYTWSNPQKYAAKIVPEAMKEFEFLSNNKPKSVYFKEVGQYYIIIRLIFDFFQYRSFADFIPAEEKNKTFISITNWLSANCNNLNYGIFLKERITSGSFHVPLECHRWSIEYMEYAYKNGMMCNRISLPMIDEHYKKIQELMKNYYLPRYKGKGQPGVLQDIDYMLKHYDENRNKIINTPERCKG